MNNPTPNNWNPFGRIDGYCWNETPLHLYPVYCFILVHATAKHLIYSLARSGMPMTTGGGPPAAAKPNPAKQEFPAVLKDELPSSVILRYMDGITKRVQKLNELRLM